MSKQKNPNPLHDPVRFAEDVLGAELWSGQERILHALESSRRVAVKACHASGKTFAAALAALWFAARFRDSRVLIIAPGWMIVRSVLWHQIHSLLARAHVKLPLDVVNQTEIRLDRGLILGMSTNDSARLQGHHAEHILIIADEAPGIHANFWPSIEGILASGDSRLLLLGNPTIPSGTFYEAFGRARQAWHTINISAWDLPNLRGLTLERLLDLPDDELDHNIVPYLTTRRWVAERYHAWWNGSIENSPLWAARVLGEFPSSSSNALIPIWALEACLRAPDDPGRDIIVGCDPAGPGKDLTAIVACSGGAILASTTFTDADARGAVLAWLRQFDDRLQTVNIDSAGLGYYFAQHIHTAGYRTESINVASAPIDKERFTNLKAERYWQLRERFQHGDVSGLTDQMLAELASITWLIDPRGKTMIEWKKGVTATLGHSPDLAEALMLALGGPVSDFSYTSIYQWERRRERPAKREQDHGWLHGAIGRGQHVSRRWRGTGF